jgi:amino acid transporter
MTLRLSQSTMEDPLVLFMNCTFLTPLSVMVHSNIFSFAASVFYWLIAASVAELASAIPSSGGGSFNYKSFNICTYS